MQAASAFGKRKVATPQRTSSVAPKTAPAAVDDDGEDATTPEVSRARFPFVTLALIIALSIIYWVEAYLGSLAGFASGPGVSTLTGMGAVDGALVFQQGEWWRIFTAPLLHGSLSHLLGNALALFFAGLILERLIGAAWFGAVFVISALGGAAGSLAMNPDNLVSVGASGAIVGLLAAAFVCSFLFEGEQLRRRMQRISLRFLVPSLLPALLPAATGGGTQTDYGAHIGGALAGAAVGFILSEIWPEMSLRPPLRRFASGLSIAGVLAAIVAFSLASAQYSAYAAPKDDGLIPENQLPQKVEDGIARSADLTSRYPRDPRAHLFRALYFVGRENAGDAERQVRLGLREPELLKALPSQVEHSLKVMLAVVLVYEDRTQEAITIAKPLCEGASSSDRAKLRELIEAVPEDVRQLFPC